jgi:hypothetical protein
MIYHRYIDNIKDLKKMFDGSLTEDKIKEWKNGKVDYLIEVIGHPYHKAFFSKPELVEKWERRIVDPNNKEERLYRKMCEKSMRPYLGGPKTT